MSATKKHIVFITSSLANTGSESLLFHFINFLAPRYVITVICYTEGSLIQSLDKSVRVHILNYKKADGFFAKIRMRFRLHIAIPALLNRYKKFTWYINTLVLPIPVKFASDHGIRFILHAHELEHMYALLSAQQLNLCLNKPEILIANSEITRAHLIKAGSTKSIKIIHPFIDLNRIKSFKNNEINFPSSQFCWLMAGTIDANKNPELFVKIAAEAKKQDLPYTFIWLYQSCTEHEIFSRVQKNIKENDLPVQFIQTLNYDDYLSRLSKANGFILTSTYESFSLVTLEALALDLAVVVNDCGGVLEIVNKKMASIVPVKSEINTYLACMKFELERLDSTRSEKSVIIHSFDKNKILADWEKLAFLNTKS